MLRRMKDADLETVVMIDALSFPIAWNQKQYMYELHDNAYAKLYVLINESGIIGFIDFWVTFEICQLAKIAILPQARGRRYAHALMDQMIIAANEERCETISLEVRVSNTSAQALYHAYDFIQVNKRKSYYQDNGEDALVMMRALGGVQ